MADTFINGTSGNDVLQAPASGGSAGVLVLTVSGSPAQGISPVFNLLINGSIALANITATADHFAGATQQVSVPVGAGVSSIGIAYINDPQTDFTEDRNLYVSSVSLNGTTLPLTSALYDRDGFTGADKVIAGREDMKWGGTMTFSGAVVQNAAAGAGGGGTVFIDGGAGNDTVNFTGLRSAYTISHQAAGYSVSKADLSASVTNVERLHFQDSNVAFVDTDANALFTAKLIAALFGTSALGIREYVGIGIRLLDQGTSHLDLANLAVHTGQYQALAGSFSNTDFVKLVYHNVVGVDATPDALSFFVGLLDSGQQTQASLALLAADTSFNVAHLVGVQQTGIDFVAV